ncbi:SLC13 family permease [Nannocystaceae bacterium ST9]
MSVLGLSPAPTSLVELGFDAWLTAVVLGVILVGLVRDWLGPDVLLTAGVTTLVLAGVLEPGPAFAGFANEGVLTIAGLFVVARAVEESGALDRLAHSLLGMQGSERGALVRTMVATAGISTVLNNTPVVAMLAPTVRRWARQHGVSPKRLLIPVSYAAILGGVCTLIGTSTNLVVAGMMRDAGMGELGMFEITGVGLPCAVMGIAFMAMIGRHLLPNVLEPLPRGGEVETTEEHAVPEASSKRQLGVLALVVAMILIPFLTPISLLTSVFTTALVLLFSGSISVRSARQSLHLEVLVTVAMAFGMGKALSDTGLANMVAHVLVAPAAPYGTLALFAAVFLATSIFTELITNNAAAVLMFPIAYAAAQQVGVDPRPLVILVAVAASCSFATPIGYQTNMMVAQLGGYRVSEFLRVGVPMNLLMMVTGTLSAWLLWG